MKYYPGRRSIRLSLFNRASHLGTREGTNKFEPGVKPRLNLLTGFMSGDF